MHTLDHFTDASFDTSFISKIRHILACFTDDDSSFFGGHNGTQSELRLCIFFIGSGCRLPIWSESIVLAILRANADTAHGIREICLGSCFGSHFESE